MIVRSIVKLVRVLNSNQKIGEVAGGVACGFLLACIPGMNLLWIGLLLITFLLKVNFAAVLVSMALFKLLMPLGDPALHLLGTVVLTFDPLQGFFALLYNLAVVPFTRFNNTIVMGGFLAGLILWIPVFLLFKLLIRVYRRQIRDRINNSKFAKWFKKLPLISGLVRAFTKAGTIGSSL